LIEARTTWIPANVFTNVVSAARYAKRRFAICGVYHCWGVGFGVARVQSLARSTHGKLN